MSEKPVMTQKAPYAVDVEAGKSYYWCSCGKSSTQPLCDGKHKGSSFAPKEYKATTTGKVYFCGCRQSKSPQLCDGTHKGIK